MTSPTSAPASRISRRPEHIKRAAIQALEENRTKYTPTPGIAPLRQAICDWHARELGSSYQPAECIVNVGGKHAIFNAVCSLINPGDEVVIPAPYWVSYPDIVKYAGGKPVFVETRAEDDFVLRAADLEKVITPRTRMVIADSPSNPTGAVIPPDEFAKILAVCQRHGVWLLSDECYSHFTYGDAKPFSVASVPGSEDRLIIVGSFSKTFAMTGWRMGYVLAPQPLIAADHQTAEPVHIESHFDRAICGARPHARPDGFGARRCSPNMRGAASASRGPARDSGRHLHGSAGRVLRVPEYFGASQCRDAERHGRGEAAARTRTRRRRSRRSVRRARAICAFPTPLRSSASTKDCAASLVSSARSSAPVSDVILCPARLEPDFQPASVGLALARAVFPEKSDLAEPIGEAWMTGSECRFANGPFAGQKLGEAWPEMPAEWTGTRIDRRAATFRCS